MRAKSVNEKFNRGGDPFSTMGVGAKPKALEALSAHLREAGIEHDVSRYEDAIGSDWSGWMFRIKKKGRGYKIEPVIFTIDGHSEQVFVRKRNYDHESRPVGYKGPNKWLFHAYYASEDNISDIAAWIEVHRKGLNFPGY